MKKCLKRLLITLAGLVLVITITIGIFFKTDAFAKQRDLWVQTAMSTSNHKWLATTFLSDSEISTILAKYQVSNTINSTGDSVKISKLSTSSKADTTSFKQISGDTYTGYVITVTDPSTVKLVNTLSSDGDGTYLSDLVSSDSSVLAAINAAGFNFSRSGETSDEGSLVSFTMMKGELLYGDKETTYQMIGLTDAGKLILGNYSYTEALSLGVKDAITFGPYLLVDGKEQITDTATGGYQPRTAIGQAADGTIYMVVINGRSSSSVGATLYDLQIIMSDLGAVNAVNLDGGGSSEMYYDGELVNTLSNSSERAIPNAFVVTKK